jgi:hypothetical protein
MTHRPTRTKSPAPLPSLLMPRSSNSDLAEARPTTSISFKVDNLEPILSHLQTWQPDLQITQGSASRQVRLVDPDSNVIELFEVVNHAQRAQKNIYHLATQAELVAGLSDHYYLPPDVENRFIHERARSAFMAIACKRIALESGSTPLIIEMDQSKLSVAEDWFDESDFDSGQAPQPNSTYPQIHTPIPRDAITAVGRCAERDADMPWPDRFVSLNSILKN